MRILYKSRGHAVEQLVEVLRYKPEGSILDGVIEICN
jgi:hypothetical protein